MPHHKWHKYQGDQKREEEAGDEEFVRHVRFTGERNDGCCIRQQAAMWTQVLYVLSKADESASISI